MFVVFPWCFWTCFSVLGLCFSYAATIWNATSTTFFKLRCSLLKFWCQRFMSFWCTNFYHMLRYITVLLYPFKIVTDSDVFLHYMWLSIAISKGKYQPNRIVVFGHVPGCSSEHAFSVYSLLQLRASFKALSFPIMPCSRHIRCAPSYLAQDMSI